MLGLYFDPAFDPETKALVREEFVRALEAYPDWAVQRAFDTWARTMSRRPSPNEIVILVSREIEPLTKELAKRKREHDAQIEAQRVAPDPEQARQIMERAGFTPKRLDAIRRAPMASSFAEAEALMAPSKKPHWTETVDYLGPEMAQLRAARMANPLMRAGMDQAERRDRDEAGAA